jgi:nucleoside-diphosphate-sugar epimerase
VNDVQWISTNQQQWIQEIIRFQPHSIIHAAWDGVDVSGRSDWQKQISNIFFQQTLLDIAKKVYCRQFISIGSQAEYGEFSGCIDEQYETHPNSAYGAVKLASLTLTRTFCELNGIDWYWFRLFPCYGEREGDIWLIPAAIKNMITNESMDFTLGEQQYAYLYIGEVANVIADTITTKAPSGVYNLSSSHVISIRQLLETIKETVNPNFHLNFGALPYRSGQAMWIQGNNNKVCNNIRKINSENFEEKLYQTINYYIKHNE